MQLNILHFKYEKIRSLPIHPCIFNQLNPIQLDGIVVPRHIVIKHDKIQVDDTFPDYKTPETLPQVSR